MKIKISGGIWLGGLVFVSISLASSAYAQTITQPQFLITWKATQSYIPPSYEGKALPSYGSRITAEVELVSPQGKLANLQNEAIYWYQNGTLIGGGDGVQTITFPPFNLPPNLITLKITIPNDPSGYLSHSINIPYVTPQVVLYAPLPNGQFSSNPLDIQAVPYFFSTTSTFNLSYAWAVNGQTGGGAENPEIAQITMPQGTPSGTNIDVSVTVRNPVGSTVATAQKTLTYQSLP